jgi:hydrogenase maturation protein HypF
MTAALPSEAAAAPAQGESVRVRGVIQGVGFRPTVLRLAAACGLAGDVRNDGEGVLIRIWGAARARRHFLRRLGREAPPLARIDALERAPLAEETPPQPAFRILESARGTVRACVTPDAATCPACLLELRGEGRRRGYAFTNCTHCGPRLSIVRRIPYDRGNTSMAAFGLCAECAREYADAADRRFHAQPIACPACGPRLWLEPSGGIAGADPVEAARRLLRAGGIVAIKGVGGFHLACDATRPESVEALRRRKRREHKPFALMARDEAMIRRYCRIGGLEAALLRGAAAPIVLLEAREGTLPPAVAPGQRLLGFMLPYSPLHHLLMEGLDAPIVLTSGNRSDEPQCIANDEARARLAGIADAFLLHDRDIVNRVDDSLVRVVAGAPAILRRARGYAPAPLGLPAGFAAAPDVLALGGEQKATFCLLRRGQATLSPHLGDLGDAAAHQAYGDSLALFERLFELRPRLLAVDAHPEYRASKLGRERAAGGDARLVVVQHHHAHIAACLADNAVAMDAPPVLGIALDGLGYGEDGTLWGGEFLLADYRRCRRLASFAPVAMPGGAQAVREPWRMAYAHLRRACGGAAPRPPGGRSPFFAALAERPLRVLDGMLEAGFNSPLTTSCGRLFDAVAAAIGLCQRASYDGQAACELEAAVDARALQAEEGYPFDIRVEDGLPRLDPAPLWHALLRDVRGGCATGMMAARFHLGLAAGVAGMVGRLRALHGDPWRGRVALSGGVFQNAVLTGLLLAKLEADGLVVLRHRQAPSNDGGLSLGQAAVAAARALAGAEG